MKEVWYSIKANEEGDVDGGFHDPYYPESIRKRATDLLHAEHENLVHIGTVRRGLDKMEVKWARQKVLEMNNNPRVFMCHSAIMTMTSKRVLQQLEGWKN
ncbi:MAG: hypothetical protein Q8K86_08235 [Candidatus Nanopelagicaceae bacterium]|nr:hypothetical protein [Candidatus Nanopelagicaceae bacterium]